MGEVVAFRRKIQASGRVVLSEDDIATYAQRLERMREQVADSLAVKIAKVVAMVSGAVLVLCLVFQTFG